MGKIQKTGRWVHELNDRQMEKLKNIRDILLALYKRKSFLLRIVHHRTEDEKWIYFESPNPKNHG